MSDDYSANISTYGWVNVDGSTTGSIETQDDIDWIGCYLFLGTTYQVSLRGSDSSGGTLGDPVINNIYDYNGNLVSGTYNDDGGSGADSLISFTPNSTGYFYVAARGYSSNIGTYTLSVSSSSNQPSNLPTLSISPSNAPTAEGNSGTTAYTFTVTRAGDLSATSSANWSVTGSGTSPANGADFVGGSLPAGTVTFAAGASTATVTVNVQGDTGYESNDGFTVTLANPVGATLGTSSVGNSLSDSASGGYGVTENFYTLAGGGGTFTLGYDMYGIPDRADIYVDGVLQATTNGEVSYTGTLSVPSTVLYAGSQVRVVMTGTDTGTAWDYTVNYSGGVQSLNYIAAGVIINDDSNITPIPTVSYTVPGTLGNDYLIPSAGNNYMGGGGNDTYILSPHTLTGAVTAKITDTDGSNVIQFVDGMTLVASRFFNNALEVTLSTGAKTQILGASGFSYQVGANAPAGDTSTSLTYAQFGAMLGVSIPSVGGAAVDGTANFVVPSSGSSSGSIVDLNFGTVQATALAEEFRYDFQMIGGRATRAGDGEATINGFNTTMDKLVFVDTTNHVSYTEAQFKALAGVSINQDPFANATSIYFDALAGISGGVTLTGIQDAALSSIVLETM